MVVAAGVVAHLDHLARPAHLDPPGRLEADRPAAVLQGQYLHLLLVPGGGVRLLLVLVLGGGARLPLHLRLPRVLLPKVLLGRAAFLRG